MKNIIPTLAVADIDASVRFYAEVLGFDVGFTLPGEDGKLIHASVQRGDSYLMFGRIDPSNPHDQSPLGRGVVLYATVADDEDIDAYFQRVKECRRHGRPGADGPVLGASRLGHHRSGRLPSLHLQSDAGCLR